MRLRLPGPEATQLAELVGEPERAPVQPTINAEGHRRLARLRVRALEVERSRAGVEGAALDLRVLPPGIRQAANRAIRSNDDVEQNLGRLPPAAGDHSRFSGSR